MGSIVEKVTVFITRHAGDTDELLLFEHPAAGIQIPAGTVEVGETPAAAALREAAEETGLTDLTIRQYLGATKERLERERVITTATSVYVRPDPAGVAWARLPRGLTVTLENQVAGFAQVTYQEFDRLPDPQYVTYHITGWVPDGVLADTKRRHFFQLTFDGPSADRWVVAVDNQHFTLFWAPVTALPAIIAPQDTWLTRWQAYLRSP
jgi:8-oxo-dGTP pyrophosphatase MutT (NUDIX family)